MENSQECDPDEYPFYELYKLRDKETKFLADLSGIDLDLSSTVGFCRVLLKLTLQEEPEILLIDALATAAIIRYSRCFTKAVRNMIPNEY